MIKTPTDQLEPGDILAEPVTSKTGFVIFSAGDVLTSSHISTMLQWGIESICIEGGPGSPAQGAPKSGQAKRASSQAKTPPQAQKSAAPVRQSAPPAAGAQTPPGQKPPVAPPTVTENEGDADLSVFPEPARNMSKKDIAAAIRQVLTERFSLTDKTSPYTTVLMTAAAERLYKILLGDAESDMDPLPHDASVIATKRPDKPDIKRLLGHASSLGTVPLLFHKLMEAVNKPRVSIEEITAIVSVDPDLMARLLKLVNSPYYGFSTKVTNISRAIALVGMNQMVSLALSASLLSAFKGVPVALISMEAFWSHSICCGVAARLIATTARIQEPETYFIAGLLHDIARLVIYTQLPEHSLHMLSEARRKKIPLRSMEREILGVTHEALGQKMLAAWNFPPNLHRLIGNHHKPISSDTTPEDLVVPAANALAQALGYGSSGEHMISPIASEGWAKLGISPEMLAKLCLLLDTEYKQLRVQLSSALG